jgi:hypothetical protein
MKVSDILKEEEPANNYPKLVQVLRTIIGAADQKNYKIFLHFNKPNKEDLVPYAKNLDLNKMMQNVDSEQFDYETFKAAYDTDARVKSLVKNFSEKGIEPKTKDNENDLPQGDTQTGGDKVSQMAKSATNLGDNL